jgi:hypothetical protein
MDHSVRVMRDYAHIKYQYTAIYMHLDKKRLLRSKINQQVLALNCTISAFDTMKHNFSQSVKP